MSSRRTLSPALAVAVLALVVSLVGTAHAAGGSLLLGAKNQASKATTLKVKKGADPALKLVSKHGSAASFKSAGDKPPFTVNSSQVVPGLDADQLDGLDSSAFARIDTTSRTAFVVRTTPVNVPSATTLPLIPNAEQYDPSDMFSAPNLVATVTGTYLVSATVTWATDGSGYRSLELTGGTPGGGARLVQAPASPPAITQQSISGLVHLTSGQPVGVQAGQSSGGPLAVTLDKLQLTYVGP